MIRAELTPDVCRCGEPLDGAVFHDDVDGEQTCEVCCHTCQNTERLVESEVET